jgi:hypothetical protein
MEKTLINVDNSDNYHKEPNYGFKYRNLNNINVFYDEVHRRLIPNYRQLFISYAGYYLTDGKNPQKTVGILDTMNKYISTTQFPLTYDYVYRISKLYNDAGAKEQASKYALQGIQTCDELIKNPHLNPDLEKYEIIGKYFGPFRISAMLFEILGDYKSAADRLKQLHERTVQIFTQIKDNPQYQEEAQKMQYNIVDLQAMINDYTLDGLVQAGDLNGAIKSAKEMIVKYNDTTSQVMIYLKRYVEIKLKELEAKRDSSIARR